MPLLRGSIEVARLSLDGPDIVLETLADGRPAWPVPSGAPGQAALVLDRLGFQDITLEKGTLRRIVDAHDETLNITQAKLGAPRLEGPWEIQGAGAWRGQSMSASLTLSGVASDGARRVGLDLELTEPAGKWNVSGRARGTGFEGRIEGEGADLGGLLARARAALPGLPGAPTLPFNLSAKVHWDGSLKSLSDASLEIAGADFDVHYEREEEGTRLSVTSKRIDWDALTSRPPSAVHGSPSQAARLPRDLESTLEISIGSVLLRERLVRDVSLRGKLEDGVFRLEKAGAQLPGGTSLTLSGEVTQAREGLALQGSFDAEANNLRETLDWLGADLSAVPAARLRRAELKGRVEFEKDTLTLPAFKGRFDLTEAEGAIAVVLRDRPGLGLKLRFDRFDAADYFPGLMQAAPTAEISMPDWSTLAALLNFADANFRLDVDTLELGSDRVEGLVLEGALKDAVLDLKEASARSLLGNEAAYQGRIDMRGLGPRFDGHLAIVVDRPGALGRALSDAWTPFVREPGYTLFSGIQGGLERLRLSGAFQEDGGEVAFAGDAALFEGELALRLDLGYGEGETFLRRLGVDLPAAALSAGGASALTGSLGYRGGEWLLEDLNGRLLGYDLAGRIELTEGEEGGGARWQADLQAGEVPADVFLALLSDGATTGLGDTLDGIWSRRAFDTSGLPFGQTGRLSLKGAALTWPGGALRDVELSVALSPDEAELERLTGRLGDGTMIVTGSMTRQPQPAFDMTMTALDLSPGALMDPAGTFGAPTGGLTVNLKIAGAGASPNAMVESLTGGGEIAGRLGFEGWRTGALEETVQRDLGISVARLSGVESALARTEMAFASGPGEIKGRVRIDRGVHTLEDFQYLGDGLALEAEGVVDLPRWKVGARAGIIEGQVPDRPLLALEWSGRLSAPDLRLLGRALDTPEAVRN